MSRLGALSCLVLVAGLVAIASPASALHYENTGSVTVPANGSVTITIPAGESYDSFDGFGNSSISEVGGSGVYTIYNNGSSPADFTIDFTVPPGGGSGYFYENGQKMPGVPEPAVWVLMTLGVGAVGGVLRLQTRTRREYAHT